VFANKVSYKTINTFINKQLQKRNIITYTSTNTIHKGLGHSIFKLDSAKAGSTKTIICVQKTQPSNIYKVKENAVLGGKGLQFMVPKKRIATTQMNQRRI